MKLLPTLTLLALFGIRCAPLATAQSTMEVYVVRHAEKADPTDPDTPLSAAGNERAHDLAKRLSRVAIGRIYATTKLRTQQTVAVVAEQRRLEPILLDPGATDELVARIRTECAGMRVLVAGHSHTVPAIVLALSGKKIEDMPDDRYDRLYHVTIPAEGPVTVKELRYGATTP
jgi:broad specificity phosphatase PhoE